MFPYFYNHGNHGGPRHSGCGPGGQWNWDSPWWGGFGGPCNKCGHCCYCNRNSLLLQAAFLAASYRNRCGDGCRERGGAFDGFGKGFPGGFGCGDSFRNERKKETPPEDLRGRRGRY